MKETILIITFLSIVLIFIFIHASEVSFHEAFTGEHYLVRNLDDKDKAANTLANMKTKLKTLVEHTMKQCENTTTDSSTFIKPYINTINNKFNFIIFRESTDNSQFTSYSVNKGEEMIFCIKSRRNNEYHDINLLMYVAIHELGHIACPEIGHTALYNDIFGFLLKKGIELNIYNMDNYSVNPVEYCGMEVYSNILS